VNVRPSRGMTSDYQAHGGLCNRRPQTPPGPEGSNGSGLPDVTQYPPGLARRNLPGERNMLS